MKVSAPTPTSPINDAQAADNQPTLTASASTPKFDPSLGPLQYRFEVYSETGAKVQDSGLMSSPSFKITATLSFKQRQTWRVRAEFQGLIGPWSPMASFISAEGGYIRGNEAFDPIFNGQTLGQIIGQATFVPNVGIRIENTTSYVKYAIPQTITSGEFSVEVLGLRPNAPGGKLKVMSMSSAFPDFTTDPYRFDIQYRGSSGSPPNAITFRALYGSADDLSVRYEPDTGTRNTSVFLLNPATPYLWKVTWGSRGPRPGLRRRHRRQTDLQRRREVFERHVQPGPAICVSRRAAPTQRRRREHPGDDLPQRVDRRPSAAVLEHFASLTTLDLSDRRTAECLWLTS